MPSGSGSEPELAKFRVMVASSGGGGRSLATSSSRGVTLNGLRSGSGLSVFAGSDFAGSAFVDFDADSSRWAGAGGLVQASESAKGSAKASGSANAARSVDIGREPSSGSPATHPLDQRLCQNAAGRVAMPEE